MAKYMNRQFVEEIQVKITAFSLLVIDENLESQWIPKVIKVTGNIVHLC